MTEIIQSNPIIDNTARVSFTCTPSHGTISFTDTFDTYTYSSEDGLPAIEYHWVYESLTFTGTLDTDFPIDVSEWEWDFGDGTRGFGQTITKYFKSVNIGQNVHLRVRATNGWVGYASMNLMLTASGNWILNPNGDVNTDNWTDVDDGDPDRTFVGGAVLPAGLAGGLPTHGFHIIDNVGITTLVEQNISLVGGVHYQSSIWIHQDAGTSRLQIKDPSATTLNTMSTTTTGSWVNLINDFVATTTGSYQLRVLQQHTSAQEVFFTDVELTLAP